MTPTQRIPIPTDSYDHSNCDLATLTSIKTLITCFDTTMDSFHESIETLVNRLDSLTERTSRVQSRLESMQRIAKEEEGEDAADDGADDDGNSNGNGSDDNARTQKMRNMKIAKVTYPALYEHATQMKDITSALYRESSSITIAKQKANEAVKSFLLEEVATSNSSNAPETVLETINSAKPSDEWLDRASAFEERGNCNIAIQVDTVPPLIYENSVKTIDDGIHTGTDTDANNDHDENDIKKRIHMEEAMYYKQGLKDEKDEIAAASLSSKDAVVDSMAFQQSANSLTLDYYDDNMSVISEFTRGAVGASAGIALGDNNTVVSSYSTVSHNGTSASRRRRQRKMMALAAASSPSTRDQMMKDNNGKLDSSGAVSSSRQQALTGSSLYVCDLLHDTYGLMDGRFGHVYQGAENVHDLLINNGTKKREMAYQMHKQEEQVDHGLIENVTKISSSQTEQHIKTLSLEKTGLYQLAEENLDE